MMVRNGRREEGGNDKSITQGIFVVIKYWLLYLEAGGTWISPSTKMTWPSTCVILMSNSWLTIIKYYIGFNYWGKPSEHSRDLSAIFFELRIVHNEKLKQKRSSISMLLFSHVSFPWSWSSPMDVHVLHLSSVLLYSPGPTLGSGPGVHRPMLGAKERQLLEEGPMNPLKGL